MAPKRKVLIIDDEPELVEGLQVFLEDNGYETCSAFNGKDGLAVLKKERPDLVTLDINMPEDTGSRFYRNMSKDKEFKDTPVIIVSGLAGRHLAAPHPYAVFEKPIDREGLLSTIRRAIGP